MKIDNKIKRLFLNILLRIISFKWKDIYISKGSKIRTDVYIGEGTRINGPMLIKGAGNVTFGKYCAIGSDVKIITSNHDYRYLNLQIALQRKIGAQINIAEKKNAVIGNNVWIGDNVLILPGISIGNGAVIGAGTIVSKNVPPYAIVVGNPMRIIKYRFAKDILDELNNFNWWDENLSTLKKLKIFFDKPLTLELLKQMKKTCKKTNKPQNDL